MLFDFIRITTLLRYYLVSAASLDLWREMCRKILIFNNMCYVTCLKMLKSDAAPDCILCPRRHEYIHKRIAIDLLTNENNLRK